jgi:hypothetical protein
MNIGQKKIRSAVRREHAQNYLLTSLVSFGVTVILTREFLQLAGFPQIGNSVLHIAHALWGGLFLFVAVLLPLAFANRWALQASAALSGIGIGLFIDEVGKFITQANDYFYPPALSLIYGFFLLNVFVYVYFRRPNMSDPRKTMYQALLGLLDMLDGDLDWEEASRIRDKLAIAKKSKRSEIASLADAIGEYLQKEKDHLVKPEPGPWKRFVAKFEEQGKRLGRRLHRAIISVILILWVAVVIGFFAAFFLDIPSISPQIVEWRNPIIVIQGLIGSLMIAASLAWFRKREEQGIKFAVSGFLLSLVALQTLYFYLSQFSALTAALSQLVFLQILFTYRRWYLNPQTDQLMTSDMD